MWGGSPEVDTQTERWGRGGGGGGGGEKEGGGGGGGGERREEGENGVRERGREVRGRGGESAVFFSPVIAEVAAHRPEVDVFR